MTSARLGETFDTARTPSLARVALPMHSPRALPAFTREQCSEVECQGGDCAAFQAFCTPLGSVLRELAGMWQPPGKPSPVAEAGQSPL